MESLTGDKYTLMRIEWCALEALVPFLNLVETDGQARITEPHVEMFCDSSQREHMLECNR
jgi:hypothetical protein